VDASLRGVEGRRPPAIPADPEGHAGEQSCQQREAVTIGRISVTPPLPAIEAASRGTESSDPATTATTGNRT
jgi:hypothetical protein